MSRLILCLFVLILFTGCEGKETPREAVSFAEASCSPSGSAVHDFVNWPSEQSDIYSCPVLDKMTCNLYVGTSHSELLCQEKLRADPQGAPAGCTLLTSGFRQFLNGDHLSSKAYDCGRPYSGMWCFYYRHDADASCNDTDLNPANDCVSPFDDEIHEDLVCY